MKLIEKLTPEQETYLPKFREEWLNIGLCTDPMDKKASTDAIKRLYRAGGYNEPIVMHFDSPMQCIIAINLFKNNLLTNLRDNLSDNLYDDLGNNLGDDLYADLCGNLEADLYANLRTNLRDNLRTDLRDNLYVNLIADLRDNLYANLYANLYDDLEADLRFNLSANLRDNLFANLRVNLEADLHDNLGNNLGNNLEADLCANLLENLGDNLEDNLEAALRKNLDYIGTPFWGSLDAYWIAFYEFGRILGVYYDKLEHFEAYKDYVKTSGFGYFYEGLAIVSDRPCKIVKNDSRQLHCENGPAIQFRDGYEVYYWNGINIDKQYIMDRDNVNPEDVLRIENVEERAASAAALGWHRMLDKLSHTIIDSDPDPDHGDLIEIKFPGLPEPGRYLKAFCPRNGVIMEGVPLTINTVLEAQAWRVGLEPKQFQYPDNRT